MSHKGVKGVAMSNFNDKEVESMQAKGNGVVKKELMNDYNSKIYPEPDKKDLAKVKEFFRLKYT